MIIGIVSLLGAMGVAAADPAPAAAPAAPAAAATDDYSLIGPTQQVMERFRPDYQFRMRAIVNCVATPEQTLGDCKVAQTWPSKPDSVGQRIADRALHVVATIKIKRPAGWTAGPTPEPISITIDWPVHQSSAG